MYKLEEYGTALGQRYRLLKIVCGRECICKDNLTIEEAKQLLKHMKSCEYGRI